MYLDKGGVGDQETNPYCECGIGLQKCQDISVHWNHMW